MTDKSTRPDLVILTVGHSTRTLPEFTDLLTAHSVDLLVDVRAFPGSRRLPHFGQESLEASLRLINIDHLHIRALGGRRKSDPSIAATACCDGWRNASFRAYAQYTQTEPYIDALDELLSHAQTQQIAIMCAEAVPWRCHRWLISDTLVAREIPVLHVIDSGPPRRHAISPFAKLEGDRVTWPGPPSTKSLRLGPAL